MTFIPEGSGGVPPFGQDMNGILNQISAWIQWVNAGGPVSYDATFSAAIGGYPKGAWLTSEAGGSWWVSTVDNNTTDPDAGGAGWSSVSLGALAALGIGLGLQAVSGNLTLRLADGSMRVTASGVQGNEPITPLSGSANVSAPSHFANFVGTGSLNLSKTSTLWNGFCFSVSATAGPVTLNPNAADGFNGSGAGGAYTLQQGSSALFISDAAGNWWIFNLSVPQGAQGTPYNYAFQTGFIL
ncbi:hypothetical protein PQR71_40220 [Paraburkholderia fungorum]|uniref:hypothetical protein n=1 Tax=Paraburkholderia fungorum TaxID=134537 RepID=UPI0038BA0E0C